MALISLPHRFSIVFIRHRLMPLGLFVIMMVLMLMGWITRGINVGVDFRGGVVIEAMAQSDVDIHILRTKLKNNFSSINLQNQCIK